MALSKMWKAKEEIKQALKICIYGDNGTGKSLIALAFPDLAVIDSEAKIGTYVNHPVHGKNIIGVADTSSYYDAIEMTKELVEDKKKQCETLVVDSETKIYDSLSVTCMEVEEERAKKKGGDVTDQVVSQRGYGKIKLNASRLSALKAGASSKGITVVVTAHTEDIMKETMVGTEKTRVKIGERPALRKKAEHDYDIILKTSKDKDLGTGEYKYVAVCEKDTTGTFRIGEKIDCTWKNEDEPNSIIYDRLKDKIEKASSGTKGASYGKSIDGDIGKAMEEAQSADEIIKEFASLFKELKDVGDNKEKISQLLKDNGVTSYKDHATVDKLKVVLEEMKKM